MTATGGVSYQWSLPSYSQTITVSPATTTTYTVTVTGTNGCTATDEVKVVVDNVFPTASAGMDQIVSCTSSEATLTASGGGSYSWSNGSTTSQIVTQLGGTYTVTVTEQTAVRVQMK
ncbi:MAG: hypothetical protein IPQ18_14505 [Saprospiraceae bacterium]|nr:hypothetical protein [Saprospiraceae bacterium]